MSSQKHAITFDYNEDRVSNASATETLGMALMRLAAKAARPIDYTGLSHANRLISKVLPSDRYVCARMFEDTHFEFPYGDGYWGVLLDNKIPYSAPEEYFLMAIRNIDYAFIDCGANYGFMSALVTSDAYGNKPCVAIEADPHTFKMLERNWRLNNKRFELKHNAVFHKSGEWVSFGGGKHEARSIQDSAINEECHDVETIALDTLQPWIKKQDCDHLVLKLDVEGVEISALKGATKLLEKDPCILFEDHASDKTHEVSKFMMEELDMLVFISEKNGCRQLTKPEEFTALKRNPRVGYDFIAVRGDFWPNTIRKLKYI